MDDAPDSVFKPEPSPLMSFPTLDRNRTPGLPRPMTECCKHAKRTPSRSRIRPESCIHMKDFDNLLRVGPPASYSHFPGTVHKLRENSLPPSPRRSGVSDQRVKQEIIGKADKITRPMFLDNRASVLSTLSQLVPRTPPYLKLGHLHKPEEHGWRWLDCPEHAQVLLPPKASLQYLILQEAQKSVEWNTSPDRQAMIEYARKALLDCCRNAAPGADTGHPVRGIVPTDIAYAMPWGFRCKAVDVVVRNFRCTVPRDRSQDKRLPPRPQKGGQVQHLGKPDNLGRRWLTCKTGHQFLLDADMASQYSLLMEAQDLALDPGNRFSPQRSLELWQSIMDVRHALDNECERYVTFRQTKITRGRFHAKGFFSLKVDEAIWRYERLLAFSDAPFTISDAPFNKSLTSGAFIALRHTAEASAEVYWGSHRSYAKEPDHDHWKFRSQKRTVEHLISSVLQRVSKLALGLFGFGCSEEVIRSEAFSSLDTIALARMPTDDSSAQGHSTSVRSISRPQSLKRSTRRVSRTSARNVGGGLLQTTTYDGQRRF